MFFFFTLQHAIVMEVKEAVTKDITYGLNMARVGHAIYVPIQH